MDPDSTSFHKVLTQPIMTGKKYFVTVTATNGAGVTTSITSDGVIVDDTPPSAGTVIDGLDSDEDYLNGEDDITAHWFGFEDLESGIDSYEVALCNARSLSFCSKPFTAVGKATNVTFTGKVACFWNTYQVERHLVMKSGYALECSWPLVFWHNSLSHSPSRRALHYIHCVIAESKEDILNYENKNAKDFIERCGYMFIEKSYI